MKDADMTHLSLPIHMVEKPWGRTNLPAPFVAPSGQRIGEIWFTPPPALDRLLIKYIFTSERLSVQVHPSDTQTEAMGMGRQGKEECWLVLDAEPGACLGIGFEREYDEATLRAAALDGQIEHRLRWQPVKPGDFFYIPANTVHAIGAGISLIEIQQNSDTTYRLYDYGRPRQLVARVLSDNPFYIMPVVGQVTGAGGYIEPGACARVRRLEDISLASDCLALVAQPVRTTKTSVSPARALKEAVS